MSLDIRVTARGLTLLGSLVVLCIALLVVTQGGFNGLVACGVGVVVCMTASVTYVRKRRSGRGISLPSLLFVGLLLAYVASAFVAGLSLTTIAETGTWATCAGVSLLAAALDKKTYEHTLCTLSWVGVATSLLGMLTYVGVLPVDGGMTVGRLGFTFQYANAAAAWFAMCAYLCLLGPSKRLQAMAFIPITAMLLTQSAGAVAVFVPISVALAVRWVRSEEWIRLMEALAQGVTSVALFALFVAVSPVGLLAMVALCAWALRHDGWVSMVVVALKDRIPAVDARKVSLALVCVLAMSAVIVATLMHTRLEGAAASWVERTCQMRDGMRLWFTNPLLGIGPDNWQYLYPWVQTAPYYVTVVHSSVMQVMLDAGILGLTLLIAACVLGIRSLWQDMHRPEGSAWSLSQIACVAFLLAHSLVEFDLQFCSLACLLAVLVSGPTSPRILQPKAADKTEASHAKPHVLANVAVGVMCLVLCVPASGMGLLCTAGQKAMERANQTGDYQSSVRIFESLSLAQPDVAAQEKYVEANFMLGQFPRVTNTYEVLPAPSTRSVLYAAIAYNVMGKNDKAAQVLSTRLKQTPYDEYLLEGAERFAERFGIDSAQRTEFDAATNLAHQRIDSSKIARQRQT